VFALSFFSHMPDATFAAWLERLLSAVKRGGILVFTTRGAISLRNMKAGDANFNEDGFYGTRRVTNATSTRGIMVGVQ
jgi:hypothetical protein